MKGGFHRKDQIDAGVIRHLTKRERKRIQRGGDVVFPTPKGFSTNPHRENRSHGLPSRTKFKGWQRQAREARR